jgi:NAD+ synthase
MNSSGIISHISQWLKTYSDQSGTNGFVVGISGGIDSAVTSTLCAMTGKKVICLIMPIHQFKAEHDRGIEHTHWLKAKFPNVSSLEVNLSTTFDSFRATLPQDFAEHWLAMANTRSRLRMTALYAVGQANNLLVAGTGNKIEDFGVGFFTKYGDGGVDLSPIADLTKTEVFALAAALGIVSSIQSAKPTDGLWEDGRSDEDQIGASYPDLEWAMNYLEERYGDNIKNRDFQLSPDAALSEHQQKVIGIYLKFHRANLHKMNPIPVCLIPSELKI